jgi:histone H3/H4
MPDFFVTEHPPLSPTACVACFAAQDPGGFVDLGRDLLPYGTVYVCATCARQIGGRFGMVTSEEVTTLEDSLVSARRQLAERTVELAEASDRVLVKRSDLVAFAKSAQPKTGSVAVKDRRRGPK